jgi:WD40 repeat protein
MTKAKNSNHTSSRSRSIKATQTLINKIKNQLDENKKKAKQEGHPEIKPKTQEELSKRSGWSRDTVKRLLGGKEAITRVAFEQIIEAVGLQEDEEVKTLLAQDCGGQTSKSPKESLSNLVRIPDPGSQSFEGLPQEDNESTFYGREKELTELERNIKDPSCNLIMVLGMGSIGKTSLVKHGIAKIKRDSPEFSKNTFYESFEYSILPIKVLLEKLISFVTKGKYNDLSIFYDLKEIIDFIIDYLKNEKFLITLDNFEPLLKECEDSGKFKSEYEGYRILLEKISESSHKSCLIITSKEKPKTLKLSTLENQSIFPIPLQGLSDKAGKKFFQSIFSEFQCKQNERNIINIIEHCGGHPYLLYIVAKDIKNNHKDFTKFCNSLKRNEFVSIPFDELLNSLFERISHLERKVMYWIGIARQPLSFQTLKSYVLYSDSIDDNLQNALDTLESRGFLKKRKVQGENQYIQVPEMTRYTIKHFIQKICKEIEQNTINKDSLFNSHSIIRATVIDHLRQIQVQDVLQPLIKKLEYTFGSQESIENQLSQVIKYWQKQQKISGYLAGNILNILIQIKGQSEKIPTEFQNLEIRQAFLQGVILENMNFSGSKLEDCVFSETLGSIFSVAFSSDGLYFAVGDANGEIHVWQTEELKKFFTYSDDIGLIWTLVFSPNNKILASGHDNGRILLWDIEAGGEFKQELEHTGAVRSVAFNCSGKMLASSGASGNIKLWSIDIETGKYSHSQTLEGNGNPIWSVAFHPNYEFNLVSGGVDGKVKIWRKKENSDVWKLQELQEHTKPISSLAFSYNGKFLASSSQDETIKLWSLEENKLSKNLGGEEGHKNWIWTISFSPDNKLLASAGEDKTVKLWDIQTGRCIDTARGHTHAIRGIAFSPNHDNNLVISGGYDQIVKLWNWKEYNKPDLKCLRSWQGLASQVRSIAFHPKYTEHPILASGSGDHYIRFWNLSYKDNENPEIKKLEGHNDWIWSVTFSPDGKLLASSSDDGKIKLWNVEEDITENSNITLTEELQDEVSQDTLVALNRVRCLAFNKNSDLVAGGYNDGRIRIWKRGNRGWMASPNKKLQGDGEHTSWIWSVAFHPTKERRLASASEDKTIRLWDIDEGTSKKIGEHQNMVYSIAFSPDGKILASGSGDWSIRLWEVETGRLLKILEGHQGWVWSVSFSPDGKVLASGSGDCTVRLWDVENPCNAFPKKVLGKHANWVRCVDFSPDGNYIASGGDDEKIKLWDIETGNYNRVLEAKGPYEGLNIRDTKGLTQATKKSLKILGAIE